MTTSNSDINITDYFKDSKSFTKADIETYLKLAGITISDNAFRKKIYRWK